LSSFINHVHPAGYLFGYGKKMIKLTAKDINMKKIFLVLAVITFFGTGKIMAQAQAEIKEAVAIIKTNLVESREKIKKYEWIETTTTFVKGEEKSKKQTQCYYGVDGKLVKVETGGSTPQKKKGGLGGKMAANKKEDMADYIKKSVEKIHTYPSAGC
jgi:hypothetical protein